MDITFNRTFLFSICLLLCFNVTAQQFGDYSLRDLVTTAEYGEGERQSNAQNELAIRYKNGQGTPVNYQRAIYWYTRSANNGNKYAQYNLAICYLNGLGTNKDTLTAMTLLQRASNQHLPAASLELGDLYFYGTRGLASNYQKAIALYKDPHLVTTPVVCGIMHIVMRMD